MKTLVKKKLTQLFSVVKKVLPSEIRKNKTGIFVFLSIVFLGIIVYVYPSLAIEGDSAAAAIASDVGNSIGMWITQAFLAMSEFFIKMAIFFLQYFIAIAGWNDYLDVPTVMLGWTMVRDVANMFFVVILLVIAFGTILGVEQYQWNKTLIKLILAAVLINFSNLICGIFIDAAHVFTITFVNAVSATAGGNFIQAFKLVELNSMVGNAESLQGNEQFGIKLFVGALASLLFAITAMCIIAAYAFIMLARMIALWVLVILSPLAFIMQVLPGSQSYAKQWWDKFAKQVLVAPVMVFFLWLTFATVGSGGVATDIELNLNKQEENSATYKQDTTSETATSLNAATTWGNMASFFIPLALMMAGMSVVQQMGVVGGGAVQTATGFAKKIAGYATGLSAARFVGREAKARGIQAGKAVGKEALMRLPGIGGRSWQRRGKWLQEKGLQGAEKWNQTVGAVTGLQFGGHGKVMKEYDKILDQRRGRLSSSAKGVTHTILGKRKGGIDRLRSRTNVLEGEGEERKGRSEKKRAIERAEAGLKYYRDEKGEMTKEGREVAERELRLERAQSQLSTAQISGKITVLNEEGSKISKDFVKALSKNLDVQGTFSTDKKRLLADHEAAETVRGKEAFKAEFERIQGSGNNDKQIIEKYETKEKQVLKNKTKRDEIIAESNKLKADAQSQRDEAETKKTQFKAMPDQTTPEAIKLSDEIDEHTKKADELDEKAGVLLRLGDNGDEEDQMLGMLEQIKDAIKDGTVNDAVTDIKGKGLEKLLLFESKFGLGNLHAGFIETRFRGERNEKSLDRMVEYLKDQKKVREVENDVNNTGNKEEYNASKERVASAKEQAWQTVAKSGKYTAVTAAYSKVKADNESEVLSRLGKTDLEESIAQNLIFDKMHIVSPGEAYNQEIAGIQKGIGKQDREGLIAAWSKLAAQRAEKRSKDPDKYDKSSEGRLDQLRLMALIAELQKQRYIDDLTGSAENMSEQHIDDVANRAMRDANIDTTDKVAVEEFKKMFKDQARRQFASSANGGGADGGNVNNFVKNLRRDSGAGKAVKDVYQSIKSEVRVKIERGDTLNAGDNDEIQRALRVSNSALLGSLGVDQNEILALIRKLSTDAAFRINNKDLVE
ncbi:MAG: hypothetical protein ABIJ23_03485 [Candidatus Magasanikbacteria bacterium]